MNNETTYLPLTPNNVDAATFKLEGDMIGGAKFIVKTNSKPHPIDYGGKIVESFNGPIWQLENQLDREHYWRHVAYYYYAKAENMLQSSLVP
jgi:hypothetical protein